MITPRSPDESDWYPKGFDDGYEGIPPESPEELYLEGYCDGVAAVEDDDDEDEG